MGNCSTEPTDKKDFGVTVYNYLKDKHGKKDYYSISEIKGAVKLLGYPEVWECWALVAFMLPADANEYLRTQNTPVDALEMKRTFIREMTDGKRETFMPTRGDKVATSISKEDYFIKNINLNNVSMLELGFELGMF